MGSEFPNTFELDKYSKLNSTGETFSNENSATSRLSNTVTPQGP